MEVFGIWQLGALHKIESEDVVNAVVRYASGATGVIQAATAFWPGYPERMEFHGTKGTAVVSGDKLTAWDVENDSGEAAPVTKDVASGASDPMAISLEPFERQFIDFGEAIRTGRKPKVSGEEGYQALEIVDARLQDPRKIFDTVSDNGAAAGIVVGGRPVGPLDIDLRWVGGIMYRNSEIEETGVAAGVLGHPALGVAWLANKLGQHGVTLEPGHIVLAGSFTRVVHARKGDTLHGDFGELGGIALQFV